MTSLAKLTAVGVSGAIVRGLTPPPLLALRRRLMTRGLRLLSRRLTSKYGPLLNRSELLQDASFLIDPSDLPESFLIRLQDGTMNVTLAEADGVRIVRSGEAKGEADVDAVIRGPLLRLVDLVEGQVDGDALFFQRELVLEGSTEAVVALRNTIENADLDLIQDVGAAFGPLGGLIGRGLERVRAHLTRADHALAGVTDEIRAPLQRRIKSQARRIENLEAQSGSARLADTRHAA